MADRSTLFLFDVDGTLTPSRLPMEDDMETFLIDLKKAFKIGLVGGSDLKKIDEQLKGKSHKMFDYVFSENGLVYHQNGQLVAKQSIQAHMGEEKLQEFINFSLEYMSHLELPRKRGTFIEFRSGMLNVCPVGRSCSQAEREEFAEYDKEHTIRADFVSALKKRFPDSGLSFSIGGQISFDVFPNGWDKTYCLRYLEKEGFAKIHFFGDKTFPGGNDHEIFEDSRVIGHTVASPKDTIQQINAMLHETP